MNSTSGQLVLFALLATLGTWFVTALGAALVVFTKRMSQKLLDGALGMAAGVMIAASFWSLLNPAIEMSEGYGALKWMPALVGFVLGAGVLLGIDKLLPHLHPGLAVADCLARRRPDLISTAILSEKDRQCLRDVGVEV